MGKVEINNMNKGKIILKDIIDILYEPIELYYKGSYIANFTKEELAKEKDWINDRVVGIEIDGINLCVYLTDLNGTY